MMIRVLCNLQCDELLVRKVKRAACHVGSFKERVYYLALEYGKEAVVDAVMQASREGWFDLTWDEKPFRTGCVITSSKSASMI